ncbi:MAG: oxygenase MpaB family protein, partial [Spirulinaceae cyanobacterium]
NSCAIVHHLFGYEFPWDVTRALEFALLKTFCIPSISALLVQTGEFQHHTQKRYDDTALLIAEIAQWGYEHERGQTAIARMNAIHGRFKISNEDFLYVLSTFIYEPIRWINQFGWRRLSATEQNAYYAFWCVVGDRMKITDIPKSYQTFEQLHDRYEAEQFQYAPTNQQVAQATQTLFLSWFPAPLRPVLAPCADALLEPLMVPALGAVRSPQWLTQAVRQSLRTRSYFAHLFPDRRRSHFYTELPNRTYPQGYTIQDLGPKSGR